MLLRDQDIFDLLTGATGHPPILSHFDFPHPAFGPQSPIQPSSLDLHSGRIFLPEAPEDGHGGMGNGAIEHWLEAGQTAVIITKEEVRLPSTIAGFGFPPTRISSNAILMTNPGHVDPGYNGYLSFTVINMGKMAFCLRHGDTIVTLLLIAVKQPNLDYAQLGHKEVGPIPSRRGVEQLSQDFLNFRTRSSQIANQVAETRLSEIRRENQRRDIVAAIIGLAALLLALLPLYFQFLSPILDLKEKTGHDESAITKLSGRVTALEDQMKKLAPATPNQRANGQ